VASGLRVGHIWVSSVGQKPERQLAHIHCGRPRSHVLRVPV
jgi:hypothetical protein